MSYFALFCLVLMTATSSYGTVLQVDADGLGEYENIQSAINAAVDDDIIELGNGIFTGNGNRDLSNNDKIILIRSASGDPGSCIIDCEGSSGSPHNGIRLSLPSGHSFSTDWGLEGITITGGWSYYGGAVMVMEYATPTFSNCHFLDNSAYHYGGAVYFSLTSGIFDNCLFVDNIATSGGAIYGMSDTMMRLDFCTFVHNAANWGGNIAAGSILFIHNSILSFSYNGESIYWTGDKLGITCTDMYGNQGGGWIGPLNEFLNNYGNIYANPSFCDLHNDDFTLEESSPCTHEANQCGLMGTFGIGCGAVENGARGWDELKAKYR